MECKKCKKECLESELKDGLCKDCLNEEEVKKEQRQEKEAKEQKQSAEQKPYYKKWWFWVLVVIVLWGVSLAGSNSENTTNTTNTQTTANLQNTIGSTNKTPAAERKEITVTDFSAMTQEQVKSWCTTNNVICDIEEDYSDTVPAGGFVRQSKTANTTMYEGDEITVTYSLGKEPTMGEKNALSKANDYLDYTAFSYTGLIEQLEYEGFTKAEATYGADNCGADWNEQAAKKAQQYINYTSFSRSGLIEQLEYEGFTAEQAEYGVTAIGY